MDNCEVCKSESDITVNGHKYCATHYVEGSEDPECDFYLDVVMFKEGGYIGKSKESSEKIFKEIKKQHPELIKKYEEASKKEKRPSKETLKELKHLSEKEANKMLDLMGIGIHQPLDRKEKIMIIAMESEDKIKVALTKLKQK